MTDPATLAHLRHELRTPLNHIIGYGEMLLEDAPATQPALVPGLERLLERAHELVRLVNEVLSPARAEVHGVGPERLHAELAVPLGRVVATVETLRKDAATLAAAGMITDLGR